MFFMVVISLTNYSFFYFEALQSGWVLITVAKVVTSGSDVKCFAWNKHCFTTTPYICSSASRCRPNFAVET